MAEEIKVGDVVQLKSGSISMTVGQMAPNGVHGMMALCFWGAEGKEIKSMQIYTSALTTKLQQSGGPSVA
jgi:uncharacterized protein YodC (DUF2158 family)